MKKLLAKDAGPIPWHYFALCAGLSVISVATLLSVAQHGKLELGGVFGNYKPALTQALASVLGLGGALVLSRVDYGLLLRAWPVHVAVCWGLVLLTFIPGVGYAPAGTGSQSWIGLPLGFSFQPAEIAKLSFILSFGHHLAAVKPSLNRPRTLVLVLAHLAAPVLLVHLQGDDGTAFSFLAIGLVMLVAAGLNRWVVAGCTVFAAAATPIVWRYVLTDHQKARVLGLLRPEEYADTIMYQQLQGRMATGAGRLLGRGLFQPQHSYVPRPENDFLFSYFAESCGFIGCLLLLALLFGAIFATLRFAGRAAARGGTYVCVGVFALLLFQSVVNIGMNLSLLPVIGLTLPFLSAGGTSVLVVYLAVGLCAGVARQSRQARQGRLPGETAAGETAATKEEN